MYIHTMNHRQCARNFEGIIYSCISTNVSAVISILILVHWVVMGLTDNKLALVIAGLPRFCGQ